MEQEHIEKKNIKWEREQLEKEKKSWIASNQRGDIHIEKTDLEEEKRRVDWEWKRIENKKTQVFKRMDEQTKKLK